MDRPRDIIFRELNKVYLRENGSSGLGWYDKGNGGSELNRSLTIQILNHLAMLYCLKPGDKKHDYYHRTVRHEITSLIWMVWPGGSTAEYAANQVCDALGIGNDTE